MTKQSIKVILGVTLLEIMLVLAIAAMVIVMSVRYYQTATSGEQVNAVLEQISAITAAADGLSQGTASYLVANISTATLSPILPANGLTLPWGTTIVVNNASTSSYNIVLSSVPSNQCPLITARVTVNSHFSSATACNPAPAVTTITISYTSTT
ncbi:MAG: hypothetical protein P4M14_08775 [Gammaproteobacteria bacterium]|nr:hypothetical protein [Gammaproteobacteria bacterium]